MQIYLGFWQFSNSPIMTHFCDDSVIVRVNGQRSLQSLKHFVSLPHPNARRRLHRPCLELGHLRDRRRLIGHPIDHVRIPIGRRASPQMHASNSVDERAIVQLMMWVQRLIRDTVVHGAVQLTRVQREIASGARETSERVLDARGRGGG